MAWTAQNMTQDDFMQQDMCLQLDINDNVTGRVCKKTSHIFSPAQPRGILHRAFSVFLFDAQGRLLLQQRALSKITFPGVWTNTCCSHPLHGQTPNEVDGPGEFSNIKHAAVRKLLHELGIEPHEVPLSNFKFLTRLHYWAADTRTHGPLSPWGEHEIDYVLFIQCPSLTDASLRHRFNPDEVADIAFVTESQLHSMLATPGLLWSPWFRILVERFLVHWWKDLPRTFNTDDLVDKVNIHRFDPPSEFMGGAGHAGSWLSATPNNNTSSNNNNQNGNLKKQGAYGKVQVHSESMVSQLLRLDEVACALRLKFLASGAKEDTTLTKNPDYAFCRKILLRVSRSFGEVILQLPPDLSKAVMVFYLVLRALDTVEDDMEAFDDNNTKIEMLQAFYVDALNNPSYSLHGVGKGDEATLVQEFGHVVRLFATLPEPMQAVVRDITRQMGAGMAEFVSKDLGQGTRNSDEYNRYCHFVAGLVGIGLSRMFSQSGLETPALQNNVELSNSMGLFLQKTNIIRDYLEDFVDGRAFWPQTVWKQFARTNNLGEFAQDPHGARSIQCLNALVTDALEHAPASLRYLSMLQNEHVFRFCAVPQVMAIATLEKCYNNPDVFTGVVKIRKGLACKLMLSTNSMADVQAVFQRFARSICKRVPSLDPSARKTIASCHAITATATATTSIRHASHHAPLGMSSSLHMLLPVFVAVCLISLAQLVRVSATTL